jgi:hypothetical protein
MAKTMSDNKKIFKCEVLDIVGNPTGKTIWVSATSKSVAMTTIHTQCAKLIKNKLLQMNEGV